MKSVVIATLFYCVLAVQAALLKSDEDPLVRHYRDANYTTEQVLHELLASTTKQMDKGTQPHSSNQNVMNVEAVFVNH